MLHDVPLMDLTYTQEDFDTWASGSREEWAPGQLPEHVVNQPTYHFSEYFVLAYFRARGWRGHRFYALGDWEPRNSKLAAGRTDMTRMFSDEKLTAFKALRTLVGRADGKGEPDLFLFRDDGSTMFIEVKRDRDTLKPEQIECLQQIQALLGSVVMVVHLRKGSTSSV
jgi:hypothetical protein